MHTFLSSYCLEVMGIQTWCVRREFLNAHDALDFEAYGLYSIENKQVGILCLQSLSIPPKRAGSFFHLLDSMLSAVKLKRVPLLDDNRLKKDSLILLMGEALARQVLNTQNAFDVLRAGNVRLHTSGAKLLVTYHPMDLLIEPAKKAKAWEDLKKLL